MKPNIHFRSWSVLFFIAAAGDGARGQGASGEESVRMATLMVQLGDARYDRREAASRELIALGERALPALRSTIRTISNLEIRKRSHQAIRSILLNCRKSRSIGLVMELIDPGEFQMGATRLQGVWREEEFAHPVRISRTILVGSFEITQKEYLQVTNSNPSWFHRNGQGTAKVGDVDTSRFPVEQVSWFDAIEFCNRLSKAEGYEHYYQINEVDRDNGSIRRARVTVAGGNGFRLLIEAEWEYACRATTTTHYHFGTVREGDEANMKSMFSTGYGGPTKTVELGRTTAVGRYKPNLWGLHDMHGNVGEWCWDWYASDYYVKSPKVDPFGPDEGTHRSVRGGSWLVSQSSCRSSSRYFQSPGDRSYQIGFRVARTP